MFAARMSVVCVTSVMVAGIAQGNNSQIQTAPAPDAAFGEFQDAKTETMPFVPFEMISPTTGKTLRWNDKVLLPDGKSVTAQEYFDQLNEMERFISSTGHSLRSQNTNLGTVAAFHTNTDSLEKQAQELKNKHTPIEEKNFLSVPTQSVVTLRGDADDARLQSTCDTLVQMPLQHLAEQEKTNFKPWSAAIGQKNSFAVFLDTETSTTAALSNAYEFGTDICGRKVTGPEFLMPQAKATAQGTVGVYIFGQQFQMLRTTHEVSSTLKNARGNTNIYFMGAQIYSRKESGSRIRLGGKQWAQTWEKTGEIHVNAGPIPLNIEYGVRATAKASYSIEAAPILAGLNIEPQVQADAFVRGGTSLMIIKAGVSGEVNVLNDQLPINAEAEVTPASDGTRGFDLNLRGTVDNKMQTLAGRLFAFASIAVPGIKNFEEKSWEIDLYKWPGTSTTGRLYEFSQTFPVRF